MSETAYQIARRHGYRFSEEQWLKSLQGPAGKGEKGERGDRGPRGLNGADGKDGRDGRDGADGINGKDGRDGVDGELPLPEPWKGRVERDPVTKLANKVHIKSTSGEAWEGRFTRPHQHAPFDEFEFVPV